MKTVIIKGFVALGVLGIMAQTATSSFAAYFNTDSIPRCDVQIINTLQVGSESKEVYVLQSLLSRAGYLYATPNGYFGFATKSAVKSFQRDNGVYATGSVGPMTLNAINERLCDADVRGDMLSYTGYGYSSYNGYSSGVTYVDAFDPYVRVVSPTPAVATVFGNPPTTTTPGTFTPSGTVPVSIPALTTGTYSNTTNYSTIPATTNTQIASTNVIYNPSAGYTYGIVPQSGVLTILTPLANSVYNEGDTVTLSWTTSNLTVTQYQILLENKSTNQSKVVAVTSTKSASFVLTKEVLDAVCSGACDNNNVGSFRIVIATPIVDIAGTVSTFRAAISPITINRPYTTFANVGITGSKNPVNSGEAFRLYVSVPTPVYNYTPSYNQYSFKIRAVCINNVQVSIAGVPCGQDFTMPVTSAYFQQEIPVMMTNTTWYRQNISFEINAFTSTGQLVGTASTTVSVNPAPFAW
ncbi:MAG: peptidoglycan-binding domain-containing protein [Candidatus Paceibacterota bacterium]